MKKEYSLDDNTRALGKIFSSHGWQLYLVGGAVRDYILGIPNDDYDYATDASPDEVMAMFPHHCIPTGLQHGTVTVRFRKQSYEVTTFRSEGDYSDGRHPDSVKFVRSLESDLERRDFTINAFAASCTDGHIIDMHGGYDDLENHTIRAIGNPHERFGEDALRMIRAKGKIRNYTESLAGKDKGRAFQDNRRSSSCHRHRADEEDRSPPLYSSRA